MSPQTWYQLYSCIGAAIPLVIVFRLVLLTYRIREERLAPECSYAHEVKVFRLPVFGGQHVADLCLSCDRVAHNATWVRYGVL